MGIRIINRIEQRVNEYQGLTGATKKWIADKAGVSPSRMYKIFQSDDMMISVYAKFMVALQCPLMDLIEIEITDDSDFNDV